MMIAPHSWNDAAVAFVTMKTINSCLYPEPSCSDPDFLWSSSRLRETTKDRRDAAARKYSGSESDAKQLLLPLSWLENGKVESGFLTS